MLGTDAEKAAFWFSPAKRRLVINFWLELCYVGALGELWGRAFDGRYRLDML
jgi:hypothetical protein